MVISVIVNESGFAFTNAFSVLPGNVLLDVLCGIELVENLETAPINSGRAQSP